jgi:hypothetical protein
MIPENRVFLAGTALDAAMVGPPLGAGHETQTGIAPRDAGLESRIMVVKITPNDKGSPAGKLADAELHFDGGDLQGLKLVGFAVWERRTGNGRNVTFPARAYSVNGERRSFALLRPMDDTGSQDRVRDVILHAYSEYEAQAAVSS